MNTMRTSLSAYARSSPFRRRDALVIQTLLADGGVSPAVRGTGLGVWWRVDGAFAAVTEAFLFNGGIRTRTQGITQEINVTPVGDEFNANVTSKIQDVNGNVVVTGCATSIGRRM